MTINSTAWIIFWLAFVVALLSALTKDGLTGMAAIVIMGVSSWILLK